MTEPAPDATPSPMPPPPYQAEVLAAFRDGVSTGRREAHYDAERRVSDARSEGWRDGREFAAAHPAGGNSKVGAAVVLLLVLALVAASLYLEREQRKEPPR